MIGDLERPAWRSPTGIAVIGFVLVGAFYLLREHYGHMLGALPYLLLLACPLMHLFMHHGKGRGHAHDHERSLSIDRSRREQK